MTFIINMGSGTEYQGEELTFQKRLSRKQNKTVIEPGAAETPQLQLAMCEASPDANNHPQAVGYIDLNVLFSKIDEELPE